MTVWIFEVKFNDIWEIRSVYDNYHVAIDSYDESPEKHYNKRLSEFVVIGDEE